MEKQTNVRLFQGTSQLLNLRYFLHSLFLQNYQGYSLFARIFVLIYGGGLKRGNWLALLTADRTY